MVGKIILGGVAQCHCLQIHLHHKNFCCVIVCNNTICRLPKGDRVVDERKQATAFISTLRSRLMMVKSKLPEGGDHAV